MAFVIDLDGVMWLGDRPIDGSAAAVARLRQAGEDVLFVTNNSSAPVATVEAALAAHGVEAGGLVVTSAMAAAALLAPGERALVVGGPGIVEALEARGVEVVDPRAAAASPPEVVVVGLTRTFDYDLLAVASGAVRAGARLVGTNTDATFPTPEGQIPGGGAILAAVATAAGVDPQVAGKPHPPMVELVRARLGPSGIVVGDRPSTDGELAVALGYRFALVLSGVTTAVPVEGPPPDLVGPDLAAVVDTWLAEL